LPSSLHFRYFVAKFTSASSTISSFQVSGGLGAGGQGTVIGGSANSSAIGNYFGWYKSVDDGQVGDPTVNHLIITSTSNWTQTYASVTSSDMDNVTATGQSAGVLYYVMWATPPAATRPTPSVFNALMTTIIGNCVSTSNACFANVGTGITCSRHSISGVSPGSVFIGDGGSDM
jgi:hypothetical protein